MTSVQRKFAASLITLFIVSSTSYSGRTTKLTPDDCDGDRDLAKKLENCLTGKGINFEKLCVTQDHIKLTLKVSNNTPVDCKVINAIRDCTLETAGVGPIYAVSILVAPSTPGGSAQLIYKGHVGTGSDPDSMPICFDTLARVADGTLRIEFGTLAKKVSEDAMRLRVRVDNLRVGIGKCKVDKGGKDKSCLQVSGMASASGVSESRVKWIFANLVNKYTGVVRINTDNLKVLPTDTQKVPRRRGNGSRIK